MTENVESENTDFRPVPESNVEVVCSLGPIAQDLSCEMNVCRMFVCMAIVTVVSNACSSVRVSSEGTDAIGRTMELGAGFTYSDWKLITHPRLQTRGGSTACEDSLSFSGSFAYVSVDIKTALGVADLDVTSEGINEAGLTVSAQTFRESVYQPAGMTSQSNLCWVDVAPWNARGLRGCSEAWYDAAAV